MEVLVEGWRSSPGNWRDAHRIPTEQLPSLTNAQKEVARKMQISEEDYARSALAGEMTQEVLLEKARRFADLIERRVKSIRKDTEIEFVRLLTIDHRFTVGLRTGENENARRSVTLRVDENLVDDLLEGGSEAAAKSLDRMLHQAFALEAV